MGVEIVTGLKILMNYCKVIIFVFQVDSKTIDNESLFFLMVIRLKNLLD